MEDFKVGDRVIATGIMSGTNMKGMIGTIRGITSREYQVEFDEEVPRSDGHALGGRLSYERRMHGYNMLKNLVDLYNPIPPNTFPKYIGDKFKGRRVSVIQNGITYKLITTDSTVLVTYIPTKDVIRRVITGNKTHIMYQSLFQDAVNEFNASKSEKE